MCLAVRSTEPTSSCHGRVRVQLRVRVLEKNHQMDRRAILFPLPLPLSRPSLAPCSGRCLMPDARCPCTMGGGVVFTAIHHTRVCVCVCSTQPASDPSMADLVLRVTTTSLSGNGSMDEFIGGAMERSARC